ncbi:transcription factor bHLH94-like [Silene latifolia]|uniref:transcription factor bHLH94-like n=1 Tax=Silene latifolia TaxID=37657 RepID=UPI003D76B580
MALETIVFPQDLYSSSSNNNFGINPNDFINYSSLLLLEDNLRPFPTNNLGLFDIINPNPNPEILIDNLNQWDHLQQQQQQQYNVLYDYYSSPEDYISGEASPVVVTPTVSPADGGVKRKRRRRSGKNKEEVEQQRMTHIAVERNRRKQMNEYLASIRSLMPPSYVQRGDQASIVAGAINYVKELEQLLQSKEQLLQSKGNHHKEHQEVSQKPSSPRVGGDVDDGNVVVVGSSSENAPPLLFADFFSFPQYSTRSNQAEEGNKSVGSNSAAGEIEVTMVESHANVKILAKKQPKQLLRLIAGFQGLRLNVLHLNVTTLDSYVLYSLSLKVEEGCQLNSVDDIAAAANHIIAQIQEEVANLRQ